MKSLKRIPLEGAANVRDLGGIPLNGGWMTRWGLLLRSDTLAFLTEADWDTLLERNVRTLIDLRSDSEVAALPIQVPQGINYRRHALMQNLDGAFPNAAAALESATPDAAAMDAVIKSMKLDYVRVLSDNMTDIAAILTSILSGLVLGSVLFCCSSGKDLTGITAAVILYLAGASEADIAADYTVSEIYNRHNSNRSLLSQVPEHLLPRFAAHPEVLKELERCFASKAETIETLISYMKSADIRSVLNRHGFSYSMQQQLADLITDAVVDPE